MTTLTGCTLVRNGVKLRYPLEASILTYYPLCDEVIVSYDPASEDETEALVRDLARRYPKIRPIPSPWDMKNHKDGSEITIQSNVATEGATSDWVLYVQADEAIHEGDHHLIRQVLARKDLNGLLFARRSFLGTLDQEIPEYFAQGLLRLYRNGEGCVVGDGMTCGLYQNVVPKIPREQPRMFNYSRMGCREEVVMRSKYRDNFHHETQEAIEANVVNEYTQRVGPFDALAHPEAIREWYGKETSRASDIPPARSIPKASTATEPQSKVDHFTVLPPPVRSSSSPITLALLVGPGERENLVPFFWQFRDWPGDVVVMDDMTTDGGGEVVSRILSEILGLRSDRCRVLRAPLKGNFAQARNLLQEAARGPWVLSSDPDERWNEGLLRDLPRLIAQLERDRKLICGFPRANVVDGVLVNDIPDKEWTEEGLRGALHRTVWPPRHPDIQYRLLRKEERWTGNLHEQPARLSTHGNQVVVLRDFWILHNKSLARQRKQDSFYKSLGQTGGMPVPPPRESAPGNLRETTINEVMARLPQGRIVAVETGTLRDPSPEARFGDGWSTYAFAQCLAERGDRASRLYSIDFSPENLDISKNTVPPDLHSWVSWICGNSVEALRSLPVPTIDLLYLDSSDDPRHILAEFEAARQKLAPHAIVVVDDTGPYHVGPEGKGTLLLPEAVRLGWTVERRDDDKRHMAILTRRVN